jgi:hypothetical protein
LALRLAIAALAFALRTLLSLLTFSFKLRLKLFFSKRAHVSRMRRTLKKNRLPDDLREELLELYSKELDEITSALSSIARVTGLVKLLNQKALKERWTAEGSRT